MKPGDGLRAGLAGVLLVIAGMVQPPHAAAFERAVIGVQLEPPILDPTASPAAAISEILYGNVYEGLVQFAADGAVLPSLARSWDISPDGKTYVFHLTHGAKFHDGSAFDAHAARFSLERTIAPDSLNTQRSRLAAIAGIEAADEDTLIVTLSRRSGGLLQSLALGAFVMVAPPAAAGNADRPVGTGPFRFSAWRRGDSLTLVRNEQYRGQRARLDQVIFRFIADPSAAYAALMAGDVDAFANYPAPESFAQFAHDRRFAVFNGTTEMETVLAFNQRIAPLNDVRVRRAICFALDRRAIIDGAMYGYGVPIGSHFPPGNPAYIDLTGRYPHDIARARALLSQAGYPAGLDLRLKLPPPSYARRSGEIIAAQLAQVGIRVRIENLEWAQWLDQVFTRHDFELSVVGHAEPLDYDIYARPGYYFGYADRNYDALIATLDDTVDAAQRRQLLQAIQRKLADDAVNGFLFQYPRLDVWNVHLHGVGFDTVLDTVDVSRAYRDDAAPGESASGSSHASGTAAGWLRTAGYLAVSAVGALLVFASFRGAARYLARRLGILAFTLAASTGVIFTLVQIVPGDPVHYMMGMQADPAAVDAMRSLLGLDHAPWPRYVSWIHGLAHGDFGSSYTYRIPVRDLILQRLSLSLPLAAYALLLSTVLGMVVGLLAAARRDRTVEHGLSALTYLGLALPNFWLGMLLVLLFAVRLHWISAGGFPGWDAGLGSALEALTLPAVALAVPQAAILARVLRGALIETLQEDYIRSARAKGCSQWRVLWRHALPNALIPVLTVVGLQFSFLLAGAVIIENVFFLPGLGRLVLQAIQQRDLMVVQSVVLVLVFAVVGLSFLVDLSYALIDPRLRAQGSR